MRLSIRPLKNWTGRLRNRKRRSGNDWSRLYAGIVKKGFAKLHQDKDDDYFYEEPFDYENGRIANIIWDMDKIKTREEAMKTLANELGLTVPKIVMRKVDEQVF